MTGTGRYQAGLGPELERALALVRDVPDHPHPGVLFKDITPLLGDPLAFRTVVSALAAPFRPGPDGVPVVDAVAGIEARGFVLGAPIALELGVSFVPVRKRGKLPHRTVGVDYQLEYGTAGIEVHADAFRPDQRVLVVDDVLATGGTAEAACRLVEQVGGRVVALAVLLELAFLSGRDRLVGREIGSLHVVG